MIGISDEMMNFICKHECGFNFGVKFENVSGGEKFLKGYYGKSEVEQKHRTYGYGLLYHPNGKFMDAVKSTYSSEELASLYKKKLAKTCEEIEKYLDANELGLKQCQIDAIISASYNHGTYGFLIKHKMRDLIKADPNNIGIKDVWIGLAQYSNPKYRKGLERRKRDEVEWYFGDISPANINYDSSVKSDVFQSGYTNSNSEGGYSNGGSDIRLMSNNPERARDGVVIGTHLRQRV